MESFIKHIISYQLPKIIPAAQRTQDWRYQLLELKDKELLENLSALKRQKVLSWLQWNDPNGIYADHDAISAGQPLLSRYQAIACAYHAIMRDLEEWDGYMGKDYIRTLKFMEC